MECQTEGNKEKCTCTYEPCSRKGNCCQCLSYHKAMDELPGCLFPPDIERTYDRSITRFIKVFSKESR